MSEFHEKYCEMRSAVMLVFRLASSLMLLRRALPRQVATRARSWTSTGVSDSMDYEHLAVREYAFRIARGH